jgi:hypothetical protein
VVTYAIWRDSYRTGYLLGSLRLRTCRVIIHSM